MTVGIYRKAYSYLLRWLFCEGRLRAFRRGRVSALLARLGERLVVLLAIVVAVADHDLPKRPRARLLQEEPGGRPHRRPERDSPVLGSLLVRLVADAFDIQFGRSLWRRLRAIID